MTSVCTAGIASIGSASEASSHRRRLISAIAVEQRQADVAQHRYRPLEHGIEAGEGQRVAEDHPDEQHANKVRQFKHRAVQQAGNQLPRA